MNGYCRCNAEHSREFSSRNFPLPYIIQDFAASVCVSDVLAENMEYILFYLVGSLLSSSTLYLATEFRSHIHTSSILRIQLCALSHSDVPLDSLTTGWRDSLEHCEEGKKH